MESRMGEEDRSHLKRRFEGQPANANFEKETDPVVISRRTKQIEYGKSTPEYYNYINAVPKENREAFHPKTPNKNRKYSRRAWDGIVKQWRINLHCWSTDFPGSAPEQLTTVTACDEKLNESFTSEASGSTSTTSSVAAAFSAELGFLSPTSAKKKCRNNSDSENEFNCSTGSHNETLDLTVLEKETKKSGQMQEIMRENGMLSTSWADDVDDYYDLQIHVDDEDRIN